MFFFLEYGRCRTVARSLHEHKQSKRHLYKDQKGPELQANHNKPNNNTKPAGRPANPPARFAFRHERKTANQTHKKGQEPKRKQPQKRFASGTQRSDHCVTHKKMPKMNYPPRPSVKHGNQSIVPAFVSIDAKNCTCSRAYKIASLSVLSDVLVQKATM